jgi:hypothetical protein
VLSAETGEGPTVNHLPSTMLPLFPSPFNFSVSLFSPARLFLSPSRIFLVSGHPVFVSSETQWFLGVCCKEAVAQALYSLVACQLIQMERVLPVYEHECLHPAGCRSKAHVLFGQCRESIQTGAACKRDRLQKKLFSRSAYCSPRAGHRAIAQDQRTAAAGCDGPNGSRRAEDDPGGSFLPTARI